MAVKKHGHLHHGKTTRDILDAADVLSKAGLKTGDIFLDAGCGDGFISIVASSLVGDEGQVYALDIYPESIKKLENEIKNKNIKNIETFVADITEKIPIKSDLVDLCVMANVFHGFVANKEVEKSLSEIKRVIKPGSTFAIVEFKKIEGTPGPPLSIRLNPEEVEDIISRNGFKVSGTIETGLYHYMVLSEKMK
ncbi:MAG: class I SAM-dependent methyltransferase [Euryarchaeota archaeon]|nr:class I SAM-dependent methyltransferase [Euryarchaeota archaeon]